MTFFPSLYINQSEDTSYYSDQHGMTSLFPNKKPPKSIITNVKTVILVVIVIIGIVGNLLNIVVFSKKCMRKESTFRFLLYLSVVDLLVLLIGTKDILIKLMFDFEFRTYSNFICKMDTFLTYTLTHVNSVILIAVSIDRAIKMKNLSVFKRRTICSKVIITESKEINQPQQQISDSITMSMVTSLQKPSPDCGLNTTRRSFNKQSINNEVDSLLLHGSIG